MTHILATLTNAPPVLLSPHNVMDNWRIYTIKYGNYISSHLTGRIVGSNHNGRTTSAIYRCWVDTDNTRFLQTESGRIYSLLRPRLPEEEDFELDLVFSTWLAPLGLTLNEAKDVTTMYIKEMK